jgi:iron complex outermembrane receptor protein
MLLYLRYTRGYKALGFNAGFFTASPLAAPEYLDDFEIGWKHSIGRNFQYNIAAYHYKYKDAQIQVVTNNGTITNYVFYNVPDAVSQGVEFQADWIPVSGLALNFSYAFNDTSIKSDCTLVAGVASGACFVDLLDPLAQVPGARPVATIGGNVVQSVKGNPLPQASRNRIALGAAYTFDLGPGSLTLSGNFVWRDRAYAAVFKRDYNLAPSWDQVDIRAAWQSRDEHYTIVGFVRNLFDTVGYASAVDGTATYNGAASISGQSNIYDLTPPRTYGVELRYKF